MNLNSDVNLDQLLEAVDIDKLEHASVFKLAIEYYKKKEYRNAYFLFQALFDYYSKCCSDDLEIIHDQLENSILIDESRLIFKYNHLNIIDKLASIMEDARNCANAKFVISELKEDSLKYFKL